MKNKKIKLNKPLKKQNFLIFCLALLFMSLLGSLAAITIVLFNEYSITVKTRTPLATIVQISEMLDFKDLTLQLPDTQLQDSYTLDSIKISKDKTDANTLQPKELFAKNQNLGWDPKKFADARYMLHCVSLKDDSWEQLKGDDTFLEQYKDLNINYQIVLLHKDNENLSLEESAAKANNSKNLVLVNTENSDNLTFSMKLENNNSVKEFPLAEIITKHLAKQSDQQINPPSGDNDNEYQLYATTQINNNKNNLTFNRPKLINGKQKQNCNIYLKLEQNIAITKDLFNAIKEAIKEKYKGTAEKNPFIKGINSESDINNLKFEDYSSQIETTIFYDLVDQNMKQPPTTKGISQMIYRKKMDSSAVWNSTRGKSSGTSTNSIKVTISNLNNQAND